MRGKAGIRVVQTLMPPLYLKYSLLVSRPLQIYIQEQSDIQYGPSLPWLLLQLTPGFASPPMSAQSAMDITSIHSTDIILSFNWP